MNKASLFPLVLTQFFSKVSFTGALVCCTRRRFSGEAVHRYSFP